MRKGAGGEHCLVFNIREEGGRQASQSLWTTSVQPACRLSRLAHEQSKITLHLLLRQC